MHLYRRAGQDRMMIGTFCSRTLGWTADISGNTTLDTWTHVVTAPEVHKLTPGSWHFFRWNLLLSSVPPPAAVHTHAVARITLFTKTTHCRRPGSSMSTFSNMPRSSLIFLSSECAKFLLKKIRIANGMALKEA